MKYVNVFVDGKCRMSVPIDKFTGFFTENSKIVSVEVSLKPAEIGSTK